MQTALDINTATIHKIYFQKDLFTDINITIHIFKYIFVNSEEKQIKFTSNMCLE